MTRRIRTLKFDAIGSLMTVGLILTGCMPAGGPNKDFHALAGGCFENVGAIIEEPGVFKIVGGQPFQAPFAVDCTKLSADASGWKDALTAGAHRVAITLPGQPRFYGGVLALCLIHKSASGPASRAYQIVIPESKIPDAQDGLVASVAEQVDVDRVGTVDFAALLLAPPGTVPSIPKVAEDFAWMVWFSDPPTTLGVTFKPSTPPAPTPVVAAPAVSAAPKRSAPPLAKGGAYTVSTALKLRSGPGANTAQVMALSAGDAVVATGEEKDGFWVVTTVGGQTGWVAARYLKAN